MCHGLKWFIHLRAQWPRVGDEHPTYAPAGTWQTLPLPLLRELYCLSRGLGDVYKRQVHTSGGKR